jgi:ABC-type uncharacterized transport system fused permease/ATPase subunit
MTDEVIKKKTGKALLIGTVLDIAISLLLAAVILGKVSLPAFFAVTTSGWDAYTILVWGIAPLVGVAAWLTAMYNRAKYAYSLGGPGGL